jgi:hypothetical protein
MTYQVMYREGDGTSIPIRSLPEASLTPLNFKENSHGT